MKTIATLSLVAVLLPAVAHAQAPNKPTPAAVDEARQRYQRGIELFGEQDYKLALIEFERAYELAPRYQILYNIGQVNFQLNQYAKALTAFRAYLRDGGSDIPLDRRKQVETDTETLKTRTSHISITSVPKDASVSLDDHPIGKTPVQNLLVNAGDHKITTMKQGMQTETRVVTLAGGDSSSVNITLIPLLSQEKKDATPTSYAWIGWTATGVLAAGAITSGIITGVSYSQYRDEKATPAGADDPQGAAKSGAISDAQSKTNTWFTATGAFAAATAIAGGVSLYVTLRERGKEPKIKVGFSPASVRIGGEF